MKHGTDPDISTSAPVDSEPLPCPFCGEAGVSLTMDLDTESVVCDGCTATGPSVLKQREFDTREEMERAAVEVWNARPTTVSRIKNKKGSRR